MPIDTADTCAACRKPMPAPPPRALPAWAPVRALLASALALAGAAPHAEPNPWSLGTSLTASHESNLLRLGDGRAAPTGYSRSDNITSAALLAGVDQAFGRQRLQGQLALRSNRYAANPVFDNQGYNASTVLDWSSIERWSGTLSASANQSLSTLNQDEIGLLTQSNLERTRTLDAKLRLGLLATYALEASAGHRRTSNSLQRDDVQSRNYRQDTAAAGLRWQPRAAASYGVALRQTKGRYPKFRVTADGFEADRFTRRDVDLSFDLQASGASRFSGRLSSGTTRYELASQRNLSGITGTAGWAWQPGAKLRLNTRVGRDTGQDSYAVTVSGTPGSSDYSRVTRTYSVNADYDATAKVALNAALAHYDRDLVRTIENPRIPINARGHDRSWVLSLGARWAPTRWALLGCDLRSERRKGSGELTGDLHGNTFGCYGQLMLQ